MAYGSGGTLFRGEGPVIGGSNHYEQDPEWRGRYYTALKTRDDLPNWMNDYLANNDRVEGITLHPARSVKVSHVPGTDCAKLDP